MNGSTVFISESDVVSQNETLQRTALGNALIQQVSFPFFVTLLKSMPNTVRTRPRPTRIFSIVY